MSRGVLKTGRGRAFGISIALAALIALIAASAGGGTNPKPTLKLTIGGLIPYTGPFGSAGLSTAKNAELAISLVNHALNANGWQGKIKFVSSDTQTSPVGAAQAARKVLAEGATCIVGGLTSGETITAAQSVLIPQGVPAISPGASSAAITTLKDKGLVFRVEPSDAFAGVALARYAAKSLGGASGKTISVAARNDAYGTGFAAIFDSAWKKLGGTVQGPVIYDPQATSFDSEASQIVANHPDAFAIIAFPDDYAKLAPALLRTGQFDLKKTFISDALVTVTPSTSGVQPDYINGATGLISTSPQSTAAYRAYKAVYAKYPGTADLGAVGPQAFDSTMLCALGAIAARSSAPSKIAQALKRISGPPGPTFTFGALKSAVKSLLAGKKINFDGVSGPIDWDKNGDVTAATYAIEQFQNGAATVVGTLPFRTG